MITYVMADRLEEYEAAKGLFSLYASSLDIDLSFQQFDMELRQIRDMYCPPDGGIILCKSENEYVGCIGLRRFDENVGEIKRMYVKPDFQNQKIGNGLLEKILALAKSHYEYVRLDTLNDMKAAIHLYRLYGFYEIAPYYHNPNSTALYFEKKL